MIEQLITSMPMFVCGILSVLIALKYFDVRNWGGLHLLAFLVTATLLYLSHWVYFNENREVVPITDTIYSFCNPAVYPLFYIYIEALTDRHTNIRRQLLYLLPALLCSLLVGTLYGLMSEGEIRLFINRHLYGDEYATLTGTPWLQGVAHALVKIVFAAELVPVLFFGYKKINNYDEIVNSIYSDTDRKTLTHIKSLLILFICASLAAFILNVIGRHQFADSIWLLAIPSLFFSVLILLIGHIGLHQEFTIKDLELDNPEERTDERTSHAQIEMLQDLRHRIIKLVKEEQIYLQPNLKIGDLAKMLHTNRNYIYQAINVEMGMSFSDYINGERVKHAASILMYKPEVPMTDIGMLCGFSSNSAFYRNFRQIMGCSPKEFQRNHQEGLTNRIPDRNL